MKIGIIGHGNVGGTLARTWAETGHSIIIFARDTGDEKVKKIIRHERISAERLDDFHPDIDTLLVAIPPAAITGLAKITGRLDGPVLIDATNSIRNNPDPYPTGFHAIRELITLKVVKCFNSTGYENMADPVYGVSRLDMFMAGDDKDAKETARKLSLDAGFENCYDFGGSDQVKSLEHLAYAWINLALFQGHGRDIGFKLLRR